ncbi:DUF6415 family natural product biosynthesis protein [Streptomyces sp. T028]|uniref:DUF6415 family natural product biosynthesis protein n=1 Tax=Streptomyces sp. T028 TaxID=3394379 RepID=UPI003A8958C2
MVAVMSDVAAPLPNLQWCTGPEVLEALQRALLRSLALETLDHQLFEDLEAVLGEHARPTPQEIVAIAWGLRQATTKLVESAPYLVTPYPLAEVRSLINLSAEHPGSENALGHLRRFALAVLALLDLVGDDGT